MKRMISFTRGVKSAYVLPQKGETVFEILKGAWKTFHVNTLKLYLSLTTVHCAYH